MREMIHSENEALGLDSCRSLPPDVLLVLLPGTAIRRRLHNVFISRRPPRLMRPRGVQMTMPSRGDEYKRAGLGPRCSSILPLCTARLAVRLEW